MSDRSLKRAALDYGPHAEVVRHGSWLKFLDDEARTQGRLVLFTTRATTAFIDFTYQTGDTLLFGRESAGAPEAVHAAADARLSIPMAPHMRSLNVVVAAGMALGEALRQTRAFPATAQTG